MNTTTTTSEINLTENFLNINLSDENNNSAQADDPKVNTSTNPGYFYQVEQLTFLWILFSLIVIGNATVLIALIVSKGRKSRMNFFIKHLAAADLCVGLISVLTDIIWKITISWEAGLIACKLISFLRAVVTYASTFVLVALSIDRYDAITHPMNFSGSWKRAKGLVIAAWVLSLAFSSPLLHFYQIDYKEGYGTQCWINFEEQWQWQLYMTLVSVTLFVIPAILIAGCYIIIVCTIWNKGRELKTDHHSNNTNNGTIAGHQDTKNTTTTTTSNQLTTTTAGGTLIQVQVRPSRSFGMDGGGHQEDHGGSGGIDSRRASSRGLIPKAKVKTIKMTFVIISVFILCWSPYIVFDLLQVYNLIPDTKTTQAVATFIQSLAPLNSAANPLIYCLFSTNFGQTICNIFGCRKSQPSLSTGLTTSTNSSSQSKHPLVGQTASNSVILPNSNNHQEAELRQPLVCKISKI